MAVTVTKNTTASAAAPIAPVRDADGEPYEWGMRYSGGWLMGWADSIPEIVSLLCGADYLDMGEEDRLISRIRTAIGLQCAVQARLNCEAQESGAWARCTEEERAILNGRRDRQPSGWSREVLGDDYWTAPIPLVVVTTGYVPFTDLPQPFGSPEALWIIDPVSDEDLLDSLADVGCIQLFRRDPC